jgi:glycerol-3-phosphate cytidylyltransferase
MVGDLLHTGHILALQDAKSQCDYLIVGLNCKPDNKVPIQSIFERYMQLKAVKFVDEVVPYNGKKDLELIAASLTYHIRFLGEDYLNKDWDGKEVEIELGKKPRFLPRKHSLSSTSLKERIKN